RGFKVIAGTIRPDRDAGNALVELPVITDAPEAPEWLPNSHAVKEWNRLAPVLVAAGVLTAGGLSALAVLCAGPGRILQSYAAGNTPHGNLLAAYRALANDFGLTPVAQSRIRPSGPSGKPGNRFANHVRDQ